MLARVDSAELSEWQAYDRLEPIDSAWRAEAAAAIVAQTVANANRRENAEPYAASDFVNDWGKTWREPADGLPGEQQMAAVSERIEVGVAALGLTWNEP